MRSVTLLEKSRIIAFGCGCWIGSSNDNQMHWKRFCVRKRRKRCGSDDLMSSIRCHLRQSSFGRFITFQDIFPIRRKLSILSCRHRIPHDGCTLVVDCTWTIGKSNRTFNDSFSFHNFEDTSEFSLSFIFSWFVSFEFDFVEHKQNTNSERKRKKKISNKSVEKC